MTNLTFVTSSYNTTRNGRDSVIHKVARISLSSSNDHNIPDGFLLTGACGMSSVENSIDFEPSHVLYPDIFTERKDTLTKCETCFAKKEK